MKFLNWLPFIIIFILFSGCGGSHKQQKKEPAAFGSYHENVLGMVDVYTFDHYTRRLKQGYGFYVSPNIVVAPLKIVQGAYRVKISPLGTSQMFDVSGYTAYDLSRNLVFLQTQRKNTNYIQMDVGYPEGDTLYTLFRQSNQLMIRKSTFSAEATEDSASYLYLNTSMEVGKPAFYTNHSWAGMIMSGEEVDEGVRVIHKLVIDSLLKQQESYPQPIINLSGKTNKVYTSHKAIQGFRVYTKMGNIVLRLFDETPEYRDNFIKLVEDQYYDSLLIHRVLKGFLIQTGAADTRYATSEDIVGWQGPGYTLPMKIVSDKFHRRGAIAASKLPDARNPKNTSDGSQFYIVSGRVFTHKELDELEEEKGFQFTAQQRQVYTSIGGAPHLDNDYTVFGEVVSGMAVVDKISQVETYQADRPLTDIRIIRIDIIKK